MKTRIQNNPVVTAFVGFVTAVILLLVAFGVHVTGDQEAAIVGVIVAGFPVAVWVRSKVTPVRKK